MCEADLLDIRFLDELPFPVTFQSVDADSLSVLKWGREGHHKSATFIVHAGFDNLYNFPLRADTDLDPHDVKVF